MPNIYTCEVEVTCDGQDLLVEGSIEETVAGVDDEGEPIRGTLVVVERVFPSLTVEKVRHGKLVYEETYADEPLASLPVDWRDTLVNAINEKAFDDWEKAQENR